MGNMRRAKSERFRQFMDEVDKDEFQHEREDKLAAANDVDLE